MLVQKDLILDATIYEKSATLYWDSDHLPKACILYFHGGGLLYGHRKDLPDYHIHRLTQAGYAIISYDYPLAPFAKVNTILDDVCASIAHYCNHPSLYFDRKLPFFLMGRSAGAYLCLLAAAHKELITTPAGILSYYGYGFFCDHWFQTPSDYYCQLPTVDASCLKNISQSLCALGDLNTCYSIYVYARQTGKWFSMLYEGREKFFYLDYTLRTCDSLPCPLFAAHSTADTDVPYGEFLELSYRFGAKQFIVPGDMHDFDRDTSSPATQSLLKESILFLDSLA